jgi:two-component system phosphate regulon sensor histidine kinase PhoR
VLIYTLVIKILKKYILDKIEIIYKILRNTNDKNVQNYKMDQNILERVNTDVTKYARDTREEIEELKKHERYRREFLGDVSHELKTPIFSIQGYIHTLIDGAVDDPEVNRNYLYKAAKGVDRLCTIVDDLVTISQFETGLRIEAEKFEIKTLVDEVIESLEIKSEAKEVTLFYKQDYQPTEVNADRERRRQVLVNLIDNSIKYGKEGGTIRVAFYNMEDKLMIEVKDNGAGISKKHLPRLFERFYRVDKSRSREAGGTGLGLAIVKHILEAHGETITVKSDVGKGTVFRFTLPKS